MFLDFQVLAQAPIDGWFKAKFGMTPEELREAYKEEEENYNNACQQEMEYIEKHYANDPEELQRQKEWIEKNKMEFWVEYVEGEMTYWLVTLCLKPMLSLEELGGWSVDFFKFGDNGLFETETKVGLKEVVDIYGKEIFREEKSDDAVEKEQKISAEFSQRLDTLDLISKRYGEGEGTEKDGENWWVWKDADDNTISIYISGFKFSHNDKEYSLYSGLTIVGFGVRAAATYTTLRRYVDKPCKPEDLFAKAWEKFTTEVWGTPHPATAEEAATARVKGDPIPPVPHKYNAWVATMETIDYNQVPGFDKPLAAFLTTGGRTIRSFGNPTEVERMMDMSAIRANKRLETLLGPTEDLESWNAPTRYVDEITWAAPVLDIRPRV